VMFVIYVKVLNSLFAVRRFSLYATLSMSSKNTKIMRNCPIEANFAFFQR
jgi:hypothetical protein